MTRHEFSQLVRDGITKCDSLTMIEDSGEITVFSTPNSTAVVTVAVGDELVNVSQSAAAAHEHASLIDAASAINTQLTLPTDEASIPQVVAYVQEAFDTHPTG